MQNGKHSQLGFTFMEMLVVGAVLLIVLAAAVPFYKDYADTTEVERARADLAELDLKLTRWELANGRYPADLAEAGLDGRLDPWGNEYEYLRLEDAVPGHIRKDRNLHWINTDYDLYSNGEDGKSTAPLTAEISRDDVIRANNGSFIEVASKFR
jgi:general secretion pathway protein G